MTPQNTPIVKNCEKCGHTMLAHVCGVGCVHVEGLVACDCMESPCHENPSPTITADILLAIMNDLEKNGRPYEDRWYALKKRIEHGL